MSRNSCCVKKTNPPKYLLYYSVYIMFLKGQNYRDGEQVSGCQGLGMGGGGVCVCAWGTMREPCGDGTALYLDFVGSYKNLYM